MIVKNRILPYAAIILIFLMAGTALWQYSQIALPHLANTDGRLFEKAQVLEILQDNRQENGSRIGDQTVQLKLVSGTQQGTNIIANCPNGMLFGTICEPGMDVIVIASRTGTLDTYTVYSIDRTLPILSFIIFFLALLSAIGGKKGLKSAVALLFSFSCFLLVFLPMIMHGISPIAAALLTSLLILIVTIHLINGLTWKAYAACLASCGGITAAGIAAVIFGEAAHLSGYNVANIEALMFISQNTPINVAQILFAGILFASLGAVMDIAMDISSAVHELHEQKPALPAAALFQSGMHIGQDVMGTMSATLILAFFGGSLGTWVLDYVYALPWLQLANSNIIGIELMQALSGSFGVILTVPLAAACSAFLPSFSLKQRLTAILAALSSRI